MKKNTMMRIASVLLVAVLLTTSVISGTFAKYVTTGSVSDQARVAKFGVAVKGSGTLFSENYWNVTEGNTPGDAEEDHSLETADKNGFTMTVESSAEGEKVVAPGTKNAEGVSVAITGKPEVDVLVTFGLSNVTDVFLQQTFLNSYPDLTMNAYKTEDGKMTSDSTFKLAYGTYYPIRFTLSGTVVKTYMDEIKEALAGKNNVNYTENSVTGTLANIETALNALNAVNEKGGIYVDANTDLSTVGFGADSLKLTWEWVFGGVDLNRVISKTGTTSRYTAEFIDKMDTLLGDLAAGEVEGVTADMYSLNVNVALSVTVTQVD